MHDYSSKHPMRQSREFVMKSLYQWLVDHDCLQTILLRCDEATKPALCRKSINTSVESYQESVDLITPLLSDQQWARLHLTEQAILMQVHYELSHCADVPYRVVINESVELAKRYGGDESYKLINRLADKMASIIRPSEVAYKKSKQKDAPDEIKTSQQVDVADET